MTSSYWQCVSAHHVRLFVRLHANSMTSAMHKVFTKSGCFNNASRCGINVLTCCANDARSNSGCLRSKQHFIRSRHICSWLTRINTTSDIAAIAIHGSTKVAQHNFILRNNTRACMVVRARSIFASSNNCKVDNVVALSQQSCRDICRHLSLGSTNERNQTRVQLCCDSICCSTCSHQCGDLTCVLAHAQCADHINCTHKRCTRHKWQ